IWKYYHSKINKPNFWGMIEPNVNINASLYDIREYFQGRNENGRMNSSSADEKYTELMAILREKMQILASKIEPKIYEYGFLKE
ncbi:MAG: nucleoside 5-triphosphatase RdgB (dHAPTP, dITP,XTP-specific), partial [Bacteroidetes bacterium]